MSTRNPYWLQVGKHPSHYFLYISSSIFSSLKTQICPLPPSTLQLSKGLIPLTGECWQCTETARSPVCAVPPGFSPAVNQRINSVSASALHPPWKHPTPVSMTFSVGAGSRQGNTHWPRSLPAPRGLSCANSGWRARAAHQPWETLRASRVRSLLRRPTA